MQSLAPRISRTKLRALLVTVGSTHPSAWAGAAEWGEVEDIEKKLG
jgi:hypothetical protein